MTMSSLDPQVAAATPGMGPEQDQPVVEAVARALCAVDRHDLHTGPAEQWPCTRLARVAVAAVREHDARAGQRDVEQTAVWLAAMCGSPRFDDGALGWQALVGDAGTVDYAVQTALRRARADGVLSADLSHALAAARVVLLAPRHAEPTSGSP